MGPWDKYVWLCPCTSPSLNTQSWHAFLMRTVGIAAECQSPNKPQCVFLQGISLIIHIIAWSQRTDPLQETGGEKRQNYSCFEKEKKIVHNER